MILNVDPDRQTRSEVAELLRTLGTDMRESASLEEAAKLAADSPRALAVVSGEAWRKLWESEQSCVAARQELDRVMEEFYVCVSRVNHDLAETIRGVSVLTELLMRDSSRLTSAESTVLNQLGSSAERARLLLRYLAAYVQVAREPTSAHRSMELQGVVLAAKARGQADFDRVGAEVSVGALPAGSW
ncbi:MAG: hypothetical protein WDO18_12220 [Acidobacteriota bacterium]